MIHVTRLNGHPIVVNCDLIKFVEATPDTTLTLINGERLIVLETSARIVELIATWRSDMLHTAWPDAQSAFSSAASNEIIRLSPEPEE